MTPEQIELVQTSWAKVEPISDTAADLFYGRLFEVAPGVRGLFPEDMAGQKRALMAMLALTVKGLPRLDEIVPGVQALGRRHAGYGAAPEHYPVVGECLLWTLEQGLGKDFTPAHAHAWATAYGIVSATMIDAASEAQAA